MYQPTVLLEALLHEEKLDKKFISLLLACDEQRAFACQTPTMARETVEAINMRFRASKPRPTDLFILKAFVKQCPDEIFVENCVLWISECLKVTGNRKSEENAFDIIRISLEKSSNIQNLTNPISKKVVPRFLDQLLESQNPTYSAIQCLQILFQYYSEPCKAQGKSLQKYLLNFMDKEDQNLIVYTSRCLSYLPLIAENGSNQGNSWSNLLSELCVAANSVLHQLFKNVPDIVISSSLGEIAEGIQLKPIEFNDPILLTQQLAQRFINILIFIEGMLIESCDYIKEIRTDLVITLAYRGLSISYDMLKDLSTMWHVALISVLPNIQSQLFSLLKSLVSCCKGGLLKFGPLFCNIVLKTLKVNFSPSSPGMKQYFSKTRKAAYNFLENWVLRAKAASCVELFDEELISLLFLDICQRNYHTSNWVQELFNQNMSYQDHWQEMHIKPISSTCEAALQALCAIALTSGSLLTLSVHKKLQEFVVSRLVEVQQSCGPEDIPAPYNVAECRLHLYQLLLVLTLHPHPQWSPPINYALSLFPKGQLDSSPEVIKLCTSSMASIHKMVHQSCFSHQSSVESSCILYPFNTTNILNEKANEEQGISQIRTKISKFIKVGRKSQTAFSLRSMKALKRSLPSHNSDILPRKKLFLEGSVESLDNTKALQSTDQDWVVKRTSKKQSRKTKPERSTKEICKVCHLQKTIKKRKHSEVSDELKRDLVKCDSLVDSKQDTPEEVALVDLVSDGEISDSNKILHCNVSCELITVDETESSGSENDASIKEKMEAFTEVMEKRRYFSPSNSREIDAGIKGTEKMTGKDTRNICDVENDYNVGANEEINDAEKIVKEMSKIKKSVIIDKGEPLAALDPEKHCQVQSRKGLLEVNNTVYIIEESETKIHTDITHSDNSSQVLFPGMLETNTVEETQLPAETSFAELSSSIEILTVNQLDTDSFVVDNSIKCISSPQMLLQSAEVEGMSSSRISNISLNTIEKTNLLEEEHTYVVKSRTDLMKLTNLTLQKENAQMKVEDGTMDLRVNQDVNRDKICSSGLTNEVRPPTAMEERNNIEIIDESCTRKQDAHATNNEKTASLDNSKQEPVFLESSLTVEGRNVTKTVDKSSTKNQNAPATYDKKAASLDQSKQQVFSCEEISLPTMEDRNLLKTIDESSSRKQETLEVNSEKAASLDKSKQELFLHEISLSTVEERNNLKTVDKSFANKQDTSAMNNEKDALFDESKQESHEVSLQAMEEKNVIKTNDISCTRKQDLPATDHEHPVSLNGSQQETASPIESIRKDIEIHSTEGNEACLLDESCDVRNIQVKSSSKGVEPNDAADTREIVSPADVNEANITLLADSVKVIDLESENDGKNILDTKAEALKAGKENSLPESSVVTQVSNKGRKSVKSSEIFKDALSESKESASFLEHEGELSGQQCIEDPQEKEKEQNSSEAVKEDTLKTFVNEISPKSA